MLNSKKDRELMKVENIVTTKDFNHRIIQIRESMNFSREKFVRLLIDNLNAFEEDQMFEEREGKLFAIKIFNLLLGQYEYRHGFKKLLSRPFFFRFGSCKCLPASMLGMCPFPYNKISSRLGQRSDGL